MTIETARSFRCSRISSWRPKNSGVAPEKTVRTIQRTISSRSSWSATPISIRPNPRCAFGPTSSAFTAGRMPKYNSISISGYQHARGGSTRGSGTRLSRSPTAWNIVRSALARGLDIDGFRARLSSSSHWHEFLHEIAKLRAARLLWSEIMSGFQAKSRISLCYESIARPLASSLSRQDPYKQHRAHGIRALAAVLGWYAIGYIPTGIRRRPSRCRRRFRTRVHANTNLSCSTKSPGDADSDPLGGSYYVEALTHSLATHARNVID